MLPAIAAELGNPALTLTGSLLAFGFAQLILDPLSDRYGQRPALLAGCAAYALTSFAGAWVSTLFWRVVCRCLQGAAMAALVVYGGAWRDFYDGRRVYQRFTAAVGDDRRTMPDRDFTRRESAVRTGGRYRRFPGACGTRCCAVGFCDDSDRVYLRSVDGTEPRHERVAVGHIERDR